MDNDLTSAHAMISSDLAAIKKDIGFLGLVLQASIGHHQAIAKSTQHVIEETRQDRVLARLWFRRMEDRRESIAPNHAKTLRWALEPPNDIGSWDDLQAWLRSGSGIYWISGKAGSGKSTLIKYLYTHRRTSTILSEWASGGRYLLCNFFFSNLGSDQQKTQEGLSRTLLYQILSVNRSLIQNAFPNMWREIQEAEPRRKGGLEVAGVAGEVSLPSLAETRYAFGIIARSTSSLGRCCFSLTASTSL